MKLDNKPTRPRDQAPSNTGGGGYAASPSEHNQYNPPRPGAQVQGGGNRPIRTFRDHESRIGISVWPAREDPEQPKFKIDARFLDKRSGGWVDKKYFYYSEAVSLIRALHAALAWACKEAGEPMPSLSLEGEAEAPRREFREPEDAYGERTRRGMRGENYNARPGKYEDDDEEAPF